MEIFHFSQCALDWALMVLRLGVAISFVAHGILKTKMWKMQPSAQLPASSLNILRLLSIVETLGGIALITGFLTQWAASGLVIIMFGAIEFKALRMKKKFSDADGWEIALVLLAGSAALMVLGAGSFSVDHWLFGI